VSWRRSKLSGRLDGAVKLSEYELERQTRIAENAKMLAALDIPSAKEKALPSLVHSVPQDSAGSESDQDYQGSGDEVEEMEPVKVASSKVYHNFMIVPPAMASTQIDLTVQRQRQARKPRAQTANGSRTKKKATCMRPGRLTVSCSSAESDWQEFHPDLLRLC
jgi:hypothetical protein